MSMDTITRLVDGTLPDPDGGEPLSVPTRRVVIADSLAGYEAEPIWDLDFEPPFAVVSDPTTHDVMGGRVERALGSIGAVVPVHLGDRPHADMETAGEAHVADRRGRHHNRGRLGHDQRSLQVRGRQAEQALRRLCHRAVDERLHLGQRGDHRKRPQEIARGGRAGGCPDGPGRAGRGPGAHDPFRPRRFRLPADRADRLAPVPPPARTAPTGKRPSRSSPRTRRPCSPNPRRWLPETSRPWGGSPAPWCCRASA